MRGKELTDKIGEMMETLEKFKGFVDKVECYDCSYHIGVDDPGVTNEDLCRLRSFLRDIYLDRLTEEHRPPIHWVRVPNETTD